MDGNTYDDLPLQEQRVDGLKEEAPSKVIENADVAEQLPVVFVASTLAEPIPVADVPLPLLFDADEIA